MAEQSYKNHAQYVPGFHFGLFSVLALTFIGSCVNLYQSIGDHSRLYSASLLTVLSFCALPAALYSRMFALKAQDRAIWIGERVRHMELTGKPIDPRITIAQAIALRFAPDAEFPTLARRAADEGLSKDAIKQAIKNWRPDHYRL
jgi:hypothetical protein